jgi:hypothetical protein
MARMLGIWINVNNPSRSPAEDLNLQVGGTILLNSKEVAKLPQGGLFNVKIKVLDSDTFSDDLVFTDDNFNRGVFDTSPTPFITSVIVPFVKLRNSEPGFENTAEIYCRVAAKNGPVSTNASNSQTVDVRIR